MLSRSPQPATSKTDTTIRLTCDVAWPEDDVRRRCSPPGERVRVVEPLLVIFSRRLLASESRAARAKSRWCIGQTRSWSVAHSDASDAFCASGWMGCRGNWRNTVGTFVAVLLPDALEHGLPEPAERALGGWNPTMVSGASSAPAAGCAAVTDRYPEESERRLGGRAPRAGARRRRRAPSPGSAEVVAALDEGFRRSPSGSWPVTPRRP